MCWIAFWRRQSRRRRGKRSRWRAGIEETRECWTSISYVCTLAGSKTAVTWARHASVSGSSSSSKSAHPHQLCAHEYPTDAQRVPSSASI